MNNNTSNDSKFNPQVDAPVYDPHIVPAETAARQEREGNRFMKTPSKEHDEEALTDDQTDNESIDTTGGYTIDKEGLIDNFAIEPEMYINEPGDLREKEEQLHQERIKEVANLKQDEAGKLTMEEDKRGRGPGLI
jgi:hypothetical protein